MDSGPIESIGHYWWSCEILTTLFYTDELGVIL